MQLSAQQCRHADQVAIEKFGIPSIVLMENAGKTCAEILTQHKPKLVTICCGPGNNGGDGFVIGRHLANVAVPVRFFLVGNSERMSAETQTNMAIVEQMGLEIVHLTEIPPDFGSQLIANVDQDGAWIVDALLGTGAKGSPRSPFDQVIQAINDSNAQVMAVDLPSGLDCDSGAPSDSTIVADLTCTFIAQKTGFAKASAQHFLGQIEVVEIGIATRYLVVE